MDSELAIRMFLDKLRENYENRLCGGLDGDAWDDAVETTLKWLTRETANLISYPVDVIVRID